MDIKDFNLPDDGVGSLGSISGHVTGLSAFKGIPEQFGTAFNQTALRAAAGQRVTVRRGDITGTVGRLYVADGQLRVIAEGRRGRRAKRKPANPALAGFIESANPRESRRPYRESDTH